MKVSKNFCAELCEIAIECNEHDSDECELELVTPIGSLTVHMEFTYKIKEGWERTKEVKGNDRW